MNVELKERLKRQERCDRAKDRVQTEEAERGEPGDVTATFAHISELTKEDDVAIFVRVSSPSQARAGHLEDQENNLRREAEELGLNVVGTVKYVGKADNSRWVNKKVREAIDMGATAMLGESIDRWTRHAYAHKNRDNYHWPPRQEDIDRFHEEKGNMKITTLLPLDATYEEITAYQSKRGQTATGNKGGRPKSKKKHHKEWMKNEYHAAVATLHAQGMGTRKIASEIEQLSGFPLSHMSVARWLKREPCST